jgi:hypothetical protein
MNECDHLYTKQDWSEHWLVKISPTTMHGTFKHWQGGEAGTLEFNELRELISLKIEGCTIAKAILPGHVAMVLRKFGYAIDDRFCTAASGD